MLIMEASLLLCQHVNLKMGMVLLQKCVHSCWIIIFYLTDTNTGNFWEVDPDPICVDIR